MKVYTYIYTRIYMHLYVYRDKYMALLRRCDNQSLPLVYMYANMDLYK